MAPSGPACPSQAPRTMIQPTPMMVPKPRAKNSLPLIALVSRRDSLSEVSSALVGLPGDGRRRAAGR